MPFLFPSLPMKQEQEEQQARLGEYTLELNAQIAAFRELMLCIGSAKDTQQLREDVRKCRMATMELCRNAKPLIAASYKWRRSARCGLVRDCSPSCRTCVKQQPNNWSHSMTPPAMWCEFMKMFERQLSLCFILVREFPADMSGYDGGALSKLLVQSLRPEWNKQELASVRVDMQEVAELVLATGVVTPDAELELESSNALQPDEPLSRRRSALSFMFCCSRDSNRSPPPESLEPPTPAVSSTTPTRTNNNNNDNSTTNNNNHSSSRNTNTNNNNNASAGAEARESAAAAEAAGGYDPCTPWENM